MTSIFAILTASIGITAASAPTTDWHSDYAQALKQTRADSRPLLMVIDNPQDADQSVPSELLNVSADSALVDYDLCHVDASTSYGAKVAKAFKATHFPYVAFIDKSGSVILHSQTGKLSSDEWDTLVTKYRAGEKPEPRTVAKPVVRSQPVSTATPYYNSARPYCAKCQRGY